MNALELKEIFDKLPISQEEFGKRIGKSRQAVSDYLKKGVKDIEVINKIKEVYQTHVADNLFNHYNQHPANQPQPITNHVHEDQMNDREIIRELNMLLFKKEKEIDNLKRELKACQESDRVPTL